MVSSFRVSELQVLLGFAGRNKSGRKHDLLMRALHLLKSGCSPAVQIKIRELYRRRYPRTLEGLSDLSTIKSSVFSLDGSSSPVEPDLAVAGIHSLPSTSVTPHSPSSPVGSVLLQDTKPTFEMQQPSPPIPPVHPDVQLKNLPFYDVLDVLIKPTSLVQSSIQRFQEKFFIFALTPQQVREICISSPASPCGTADVNLHATDGKPLRPPLDPQFLLTGILTFGAFTSIKQVDENHLGKMRLTIPCRAVTCTHLQCFDAALYLQMNEKKPTWICPVCDKKAAYESLILDGLFMEILNDCSDVDEIKFQEDGSCEEPFFHMSTIDSFARMQVSDSDLTAPHVCEYAAASSVLSKPCSVTVANEASKKKVDVIDLTIESSSDEEEDPPAKRKCIFMSETQSSPTKGAKYEQVNAVQRAFVIYLAEAVADLLLSTIPPHANIKHVIRFASLTSPLTASSTSVTTTSPHESSTHVSSSSSRSEPGVIASSGSNIPDVISLD
ncbi:e3 SUMO-protein ligase PIAS2 isoform 1 [Camelus ferus]|nr:e3 SUMO-protein ligase PIAS2 isoform 1 [Camelus ferus]